MLYYLSDLESVFGPFRLFQYVTFRAGGAFLTSMIVSFLFGPLTIRLLKRFQTTAPSRLKGLVPEEYVDSSKDKVPSMGGILIVLAIFASTLLWSDLENAIVWIFIFTLISLAALGFADDYVKVAWKRRDGIPAKVKLGGQILISVIAVYLLDSLPATAKLLRMLYLPFLKNPIITAMPLIIVVAFGAIVLVATSNAVNLTDGKDGLAVGCSIFTTIAYAVFAYVCGHKIFANYLNVPFISGVSEMAIFSMAICGSCIGFLWFNCHPASMFMGDTGSLALGGCIGLIAVLVRQEINLIIIGGVFVIEALSVLVQVASFKLTGKRIFLCSPLHHHFERKGWTETQIVVRFWILAGVCALLGLASLKLR